MNLKFCKYLGIVFSAASLYFYNNKTVKTTYYNIKSKDIPKNFSNFKILQVTDIHCDKVGYSDLEFFKKIKNENPDIIVITGDIFDSYNNYPEYAYNFLANLSEIANCYYVSGNHELRLPLEYEHLKNILDKLNIKNLNNTSIELFREKESINLAGVEDFNYFKNMYKENHYSEFRNQLIKNRKLGMYNILLSHRPEKFNMYEELNYNLIFSGHAHGGQWNIPFVGRIFSPSQGLFPEYTHGICTLNNTSMIISQGLGNSSFPVRINNRLELVVVVLNSD